MSEQNQNREPGILTDEKLFLRLPPSKEGAKDVLLKFRFKENNIEMILDYGEKTEKGYPITSQTPLDPVVFNGYLDLIEYVSKSKSACAFEITNWGHPWNWDNTQKKNIRSETKQILSKVSIGRHDNGLIFFAVAVKNKPTQEFIFRPCEWHHYSQNGAELPEGLASSFRANAWSKLLRDVHNIHYVNKWKEPNHKREWRLKMAAEHGNRQGGGNRQGNYNGGNNNQQRHQPQPQQQAAEPSFDDFDSDLPF